MTADRWREIERLVEHALAREPEARAAYLDEACGGDAELRREVESLLAQQSRAGAFLETPVAEPAAGADGPASDRGWIMDELRRGLAAAQQSVTPGTTLGPYEIDALLGVGGMGEVYKARDTRLGRTVAIKVLPAALAADPDRRRRFEQEARAASALNHPHICTVHDVGESVPSNPDVEVPSPESRVPRASVPAGESRGIPNPVSFLVMEYLDGETLAGRLAGGPLPIKDVLEYGAQIAGALAAAHRAGIVHRDLKPANVMLTGRGGPRSGARTVKLLDFGLAKLRGDAGAGEASTAAPASAAVTAPGQMVGTLPYMAPEQIEGRPADARTDIWALGAMLYEMLTGARAFQGASRASLMAAILEHEPAPLASMRPDTPPALDRLIRKCLAKDPDDRWQSAHDIGDEMTWISSGSGSAGTGGTQPALPASRRRFWRRSMAAAAAVVVLAAIAVGYLARRPQRSAPPPMNVEPLTSQPGMEFFPSLSPDGTWVVYAAGDLGHTDIYLQSVGGDNPINLTKDRPEADSSPVFSPDGQQIAFRSERQGGGIFLMGRTGESVRRLTDVGFNPTWSPDGRHIAYATESVLWSPNNRVGASTLWVVDVASGERRQVTRADAVQPAWSPHGHRIAYWDTFRATDNTQRDIWTIAVNGGEPVRVTDDPAIDWNPVWSPDGRFLYFASDRGGTMNLWRVAIDEASGKVMGQPQAVTTPSLYLAHFSFSADGRHMAFGSGGRFSNLERIPFDPAAGRVRGEPQPIMSGSRGWGALELSPDGASIAVGSWDNYGVEDLFVCNADGSGLRQVTDDPYRDRGPRWSPDGREIAFYSNRSGYYEVWTIRPDGSGLRQRSDLRSSAIYPIWSPDGRIAFYDASAPKSLIFDPRKAWNAQTPEVLPPVDAGGGAFRTEGSWSPDRRHIAGGEAADRRPGVLVYHVDSRTYERITDVGFEPRWLADSRRLVFHSEEGRLFLVDSRTHGWHELLSVRGSALTHAEVSSDGRWLYFVRIKAESDIWLATFTGAAT